MKKPKLPKVDLNELKGQARVAKDVAVLKVGQAKDDFELWVNKPISLEELTSADYSLPMLLHIVESDKRTQVPICKDAVAFDESTNDMNAITLLRSIADDLGVSFYPTLQDGFFYIDPYNSKKYILLDEYFQYVKNAKVHELNQIAQALGASHIRIAVKAEKKSFVSAEFKGKVGIDKIVKADGSTERANNSFETVEVASELAFQGHAPKEPVLTYYKNEPDIKSLIRMRMDPDNPLHSIIITLKYNSTNGIKYKDAVKIEKVLKKMKIVGNASISKEVQDENRYYFEYQINFPE